MTTLCSGESGRLDGTNILEAAFKSLAVGVVACDGDGRFLYFSPEAERILGIGPTPATVAGWTATYGCYRADMVTPYPPAELPLARAMKGEEASHELIFIRNAKQPTGLWIDVSGTPLRLGSGELCGGVVVFSDVTVPANLLRNQAEANAVPAPPQSESHECVRGQVSDRFARFRTMYDQLASAVVQTADSILITDSRGIIEYVNPGFETVTGFSAAEVLGKNPSVLKSGRHEAAFYRGLWEKLTSGDSFQGTIVNRKKSGELFWSDQTISPIKDHAGVTTHFVSVMKDMTALRNEQQQAVHMALARELQQRYYGATAALPGFEIAAAANPADQTGGDYFDFIPNPDGSLYIVIADIAGHGFGSAFVMSEVRASLRAYAEVIPEIPSLLSRVNRSLVGSLGGNRYVTMFLAKVDPEKRSLEYASAGHESGYLLRSSGDVGIMLDSTAPPLGLFPDQQFPSVRDVPLEHGDTILLLTDGITESTNADGLEFGTMGALNYIRGQLPKSAKDLAQGLYTAARTFAGDTTQTDDITSVICKVQ